MLKQEMKRVRLRKMSWDPRSFLYLSQLPLHVKFDYMTGKQGYKHLGETKSISCPDHLDKISDDTVTKGLSN